MAYGYLDTTLIDFPANVDQSYVRGLTTPRGINFARVLASLDARLQAATTLLDPLVASLISFTTASTANATTPTSFALEEETEYGLPRPEIGEVRGLMLPFRRYAKMIGLTEQGMEEMTETQLTEQVDNFLATFVRGARINVLTRLFSDAELYVDRGTTATSPGFAGSGTGTNVFTGTYPDGTALPGGFTHYHRDTTANRLALVKTMRDKLLKWHAPPFDFVGSAAEVAALVADTAADGFVRAEADLIIRAQGSAAARVENTRYIGVYNNDIRVWHSVNEFTAANFAIFKTYGDLDQRNPLKWRYDETFGRGINIRYRSLFPLDNAIMRQRYGIGVGNRTAAVLATIAASGNYVTPTIA